MRLSTDLLDELVDLLAPLLQSEADRKGWLDVAFHDEPALYYGLSLDAESPRQYARRLVNFLEERQDARGWALRGFVEAMHAEVEADQRVDLAATLAAFLRQIRGYENAREQARQAGMDPSTATLDEWVRLYLDDLRLAFAQEAARYVDLAGEREQRPALLPARLSGWADPLADLGISLVELNGEHCRSNESPLTLVASVRESLLYADHVVLLGEPGSGKTFTLMRLALDYAAIWHGERADPVVGRLPRVPVLVKLRDFNGQDAEGRALDFPSFALARLGPLAPFEKRLRERLVWLLDALNEMPHAGPAGRDLVSEMRAFLHGRAAFVLSCRARDYRDDLGALRPLEQMLLRDLTPPQIHELLVRRLEDGEALWRTMGGSDQLLGLWQKMCSEGEESRFWEAGRGTPLYTSYDEHQAWLHMHSQAARLIPLCRNPFMAYLVCRLYQLGGGALPTSRADLFRQFVAVLLRREAAAAQQRGEEWPEDTRIESALVAVAGVMQRVGRTVLAWDAALAAVVHQGDAALLDAGLASNLLREDGEARSVRFSHQLIQEYFAARILLEALEQWEGWNDVEAGSGDSLTPPGDAGKFFGDTWWDAGVWQETVVILGEGAPGPNRVARWLSEVSPEVALSVILRNGAGLTLADVELETRVALVSSARQKTTELDPRGRAAAYRVLALFDADDRPGVGVRDNGLPDIAWVKLKGGRFPIGGDQEAWPDTLPMREVELGTFWLAKYPVTNWQWEAFLTAGDGYRNREWWAFPTAGGGRRKPKWWEHVWEEEKEPELPGWSYGNHPRETVNWYEAVAFCRWMTQRLGYEVRLPREEEWERAARGATGRNYPWGDEFMSGYANVDETVNDGPYNLGQTSAVGIYPRGNSPEGISDLAGNVYEWTDSFQNSEYVGMRAPRVLRGGTWDLSHGASRGGSRYTLFPHQRYRVYGFRVAALAPVVDALKSDL